MTSRRIRKLHLKAQNAAQARRAAILVEDAFQTASLPRAGQRLLVVRSLPLGLIQNHKSSATIALIIEQRLRLFCETAVYAEDPNAPYSPAVYFNDETEPYILLALRAARGQSTSAWFWPLAIPDFRPATPINEMLRVLLRKSSETDAKGSAVIAIVRALIEHGVAEKLVYSLRWQDGPDLLQAIDCCEPEISSSLVKAQATGPVQLEIPARWSDALYNCVKAWGADDARSVWLAAVLLIADKPARASVPGLSVRAQQLIISVARQKQAINHHLGVAKKGSEIISPPGGAVAGAHQPASPERIFPAAAEMIETDSSQAAVISASASTSTTKTSRDGPASSADAISGNAIAEPIIAAPYSTRAAQPDQTALLESKQDSRFDSFEHSRFTHYAGMFFLLQVMSRLAVTTLLNVNPHLVECDLPARLLLRVCSRLDVPLDDPVMSALVQMCSKHEPDLCEFVQPESWKQGICANRAALLRKVEAAARKRALFDGSGRLALALWQGEIPGAVRQMACDLSVVRGKAIKSPAGLDLLLDAWLTAMRRWCRRYARIGLRDLVCRPGRISATRTHIDTVFDHRQADIRVRKSGLDVDPGWVPWFGRVISFHYQYGEYFDG